MNNVGHLKWTLIGYVGAVAVGYALLYVGISAWTSVIAVAFMANIVGYIEGLES